jgi:hypothetical protein
VNVARALPQPRVAYDSDLGPDNLKVDSGGRRASELTREDSKRALQLIRQFLQLRELHRPFTDP